MKQFSRIAVAAATVFAFAACSDGGPMEPFAGDPTDRSGNPSTGGSQALQIEAGEEEIYLIETFDLAAVPNGSILHSVSLVGSDAELTELLDLTTGSDASAFDRAHIGATPDGSFVYLVNREGDFSVGRYDVDGATWSGVLGQVSGMDADDETVLVAFSPAGDLYIAGQVSNKVYVIPAASVASNTFAATDLGTIENLTDGGTVDLHGADIAFTATGDFFVWTNDPADENLYLVTNTTPGDVEAVKLGGDNDFITGLALRAAGTGDLLASDKTNNAIQQLSKTDGTVVNTFSMVKGGAPYDHIFGDMTVGELVAGCTLSQGFWKNHPDDWPEGDFAAFFNTGHSWMEILDTKPKGDEFIILAHQYIAAALNQMSGAAMPSDVQQVFDMATAYFEGTLTPSPNRQDVIGWSELLDSYNNGFEGVPHCDTL